MTDDPIKAALREAAKVACYGGRDNDNCDLCLAASQCISHHAYHKATAAAVAAFLRALPAHLIEKSPEGGLVAINAHNIAAAVERAAQEARDA